MFLIDVLNANPALKNLLIAVLTALATTLVVEYLAKPKLEARKARIIRDRNQIDEVIFQCQELGLLLGSMRVAGQKFVEPMSGFLASQAEQAEKSCDRLQQSLARLPLKFTARHSRIMRIAAFHQGLLRANLAVLQARLGEKEYEVSYEDIVQLMTLADQLHLIDVSFELARRSWLHKLANRSSVRRQAELVAADMIARGFSLEKESTSDGVSS